MAQPVVELREVSAGYGADIVVSGVHLSASAGEMIALVGSNGAGKSTVLKVVAGLLRPARGTAEVRARAAYLPQSEQLRWDFPLLVLDVVLLGVPELLRPGARLSGPHRERAVSALARVGAEGLAERPVGELSGGERQRVLLARALVSDPALYLLDEPATGVDPTTEERLMQVLEDLAASGKTILVATHDLAGVMAHFKRVVCMNGGVVADGPVEILRDVAVLQATYGGHRPSTPFAVADEHHA